MDDVNHVGLRPVSGSVGKMRIGTMALVLAVLGGCTPASRSTDPSPPVEMSATLEVVPPNMPFGKTPKAIFRNTGSDDLALKDAYTLERSFDGEWVNVRVARHACIDRFDSHLVEPGANKVQRLESCDLYSEVNPLAPGHYRVTKTATGAASGTRTKETTEVATFEVGRVTADVPGPRDCDALCLSDTKVLTGQTLTVSFEPPRRYIWGAASEIHEADRQTATAIAFLVGWQERDKELTTYWSEDRGGYEDIGFRGRGEWKWKVPERLRPGIYALVKEGIREGPAPVPERRHFWTVAFEVEG